MQIRNSAKAILIHNGKLLVSKYENETEGIYYLLPGGGQEPGETLHQALIRECLEETGRLVTPDTLLFIRECFMQPGIHRVEFMFACHLHPDASPEEIVLAYDEKQTGIEWLPVRELLTQPLYPAKMRQFILDQVDNKQIPIYVGEIT